MSNNKDRTKLEMLFASLSQSLEKASPEELLAEAKAEGQDTQQIASSVKATLLEAVRTFEQRKLRAARHGYRKRSSELKDRRIVLPSTPAERLALLKMAASNDERIARVTARFRDFEDLKDEDVQSALEDLMELGALDHLTPKDSDGNE